MIIVSIDDESEKEIKNAFFGPPGSEILFAFCNKVGPLITGGRASFTHRVDLLRTRHLYDGRCRSTTATAKKSERKQQNAVGENVTHCPLFCSLFLLLLLPPFLFRNLLSLCHYY